MVCRRVPWFASIELDSATRSFPIISITNMTATEIQQLITFVATYAGKFLNSAFALSFVGALAGAAGGGLAAQRVIEKYKLRDELLKEIRNTQAAMMVSFTVCNTTLLMKKQLVRPMFDRFSEAHADFLKYRKERQSGQRQGNAQYRFQMDMQEFVAPDLPVETLKTLVFDRVSTFGRPIVLVAQIEQASDGLRAAIAKRSRLVDGFKASLLEPESLALTYFGEKLPTGHTHREYADIVEVIHSYTNDLIFFSGLLTNDLATHGKALGDGFVRKFGKGAPMIVPPDFSGPKRSGLYPSESDYSAMLNWVVEKSSDAG